MVGIFLADNFEEEKIQKSDCFEEKNSNIGSRNDLILNIVPYATNLVSYYKLDFSIVNFSTPYLLNNLMQYFRQVKPVSTGYKHDSNL